MELIYSLQKGGQHQLVTLLQEATAIKSKRANARNPGDNYTVKSAQPIYQCHPSMTVLMGFRRGVARWAGVCAYLGSWRLDVS